MLFSWHNYICRSDAVPVVIATPYVQRIKSNPIVPSAWTISGVYTIPSGPFSSNAPGLISKVLLHSASF